MGTVHCRAPARSVASQTSRTTPATCPPDQWPLFTQCRDVAASLVNQQLGHLLRNNPEESVDDVIARAVARVWQAYPKFDPLKATFSTFAGVITRRVIADVKRRHARRKRLLSQRPDTRPTPDYTIDPTPEPTNLAEWLAETFKEIRGVIQLAPRTGPTPKGRPPTYTAHQACAVRALQRRLELSDRAVEKLLNDRADLRSAIGMGRVPRYVTIHRGRDVVTKLKNNFILGLKAAS